MNSRQNKEFTNAEFWYRSVFSRVASAVPGCSWAQRLITWSGRGPSGRRGQRFIAGPLEEWRRESQMYRVQQARNGLKRKYGSPSQ